MKVGKYILGLVIVLSLFGCKSSSDDSNLAVIQAKGGVRYGGDFRFMSSEKITSLFPLSTTNIYTDRITSQLFEGLLKIDLETTELAPGLAKESRVNENSTIFTFILRDDVYFHDDACFPDGKGRKVTAQDFKYSLEFACSNNPLNQISYLLKDKILGAEEYFKGEADEVEGIRVENEHTLVIELINPFSSFKKMLTHSGLSVFPKEAYDKYGQDIGLHPVGTGAFMLGNYTDDEIILVRNNNYWGKDEFGNPLPFLDRVIMTYSQNKTDELLSFRAEKIDLVMDIPVEEVENVLASLQEAQAGENVKHKVDSKSSMSITYYGFANNAGVFSDKNVRLAFNLAINRKEMIESWLEGEGWPIENGFVPRMKGYPIEKVKGYTQDVEQAKELMKKAGFQEGKNFPTVELLVNTVEGTGQHRLAEAVKTSLYVNLGVNITIKLITIEEREEAVQNGNAIFWRTGWIADYPDPENFLSLFYGGHLEENNPTINPFKYDNPKFDALFEQALQETDEEKRMNLLAQCDQMIIDDAVVMPLINDDFITMINLKVKKFMTNEFEQLDFSRIFIKEKE